MKKLIFLLIAIVTFATTSFAQNKKYKIPKAKITYTMEIMSTSMQTILHFKDYGEIQSTSLTIEMFGQTNSTQVIIMKDSIYTIDKTSKTVSKQSIDKIIQMSGQNKLNYEDIDYDNISKETTEDFNIKEVGKEEILGKKCKIFIIEADSIQNKSWVWKNIPLKTETMVKTMGMEMKIIMTAKEIDTNPTFPEGLFEIPKDYSIKEME